MPKAEFHGILAVGRSKTDATNKYRLLAMGKGAVAQVDGQRKLSFVTHASHAEQMFNPLTGDMDLETDNRILESLEFASNSSADVEANYLVCASGCGAHVVFDSENLVKFCPQCTAALSESEDDSGDESEDDSDDSLDDSGEDGEGDDESSESSDDEEGDDAEEGDDDEGEGDDDESSESSDDSESCDGDDGEGDDEEDTDDAVVVSSSFKDAMRVFSESNDFASMSSDKKVEVHYTVCSSDKCNAHIVAARHVGQCPVCLSEATEPEEVPSELELGESDSEDELPGDDLEGVEEGSDDEGSDDAGEGDEGGDEGEGEGEGDGESADPESSESAGKKPAAKEPKKPKKAPAKKSESSDEDEEDAESDSDDESEEDGSENALSVIDGDEGDEAEISADDDLDSESSADDLDVSYSSAIKGQAAWTAYFKGVPVAMSSKSSAGKNADIFDTPSYGHAVLATAKVAGVKKALVEMGFAPIKRKVAISKVVSKLVEGQVSEQKAALASEMKQYQERFQAALATAAIGINRGFFAGVQNPLKSSLWNAMSSAGVRNPEVVIDNAFKAHADNYHAVLFAQANDIAGKPAEVQESLAKTILGTTYQAVSSVQSDDVESRLAGMGTSVSTEQNTGVSESADANRADPGLQQIHRVVSSLGRRAR